jgi:hypothetical protein
MFAKILEQWHWTGSFSIHKVEERVVLYYEYFYCTVELASMKIQWLCKSAHTVLSCKILITWKFRDNEQIEAENIL